MQASSQEIVKRGLKGSSDMLFHGRYKYPPACRDAVHQRFLQTGAPPPEGVTMIGRWHSAEGNRGFFVAEATDAAAVAKWLQDWSDLLSFRVDPVLEDERFAEVIG
jgi:hypothetical protein